MLSLTSLLESWWEEDGTPVHVTLYRLRLDHGSKLHPTYASDDRT